MNCWCLSSVSSSSLCRNWKPSPRRRFSLKLKLKLKPKLSIPSSAHLIITTVCAKMVTSSELECAQNDETTPAAAVEPMSKNAQKRLLKQERYEARKVEKKAEVKERKKMEAERKRKHWEEKLASVSEEERERIIAERKELRKERMEKWSEEKGKKLERLQQGRINGQNIVLDLDFAHLMNSSELHSLVQQIMYCYAINRRSASPAHLWLTGCQGEIKNQLQQTTGYDKWVIEKEDRSYAEAFQDQKENLVYLTADSENILEELDPKAVYIIGGLVDRNRWKGITMRKADEQGIKTAKLPIGTHMKMSSSQVLTVNQVVEILLKFLETKDWKDSFFQVIPQRKISEAGAVVDVEEIERKVICEEDYGRTPGRQKTTDNKDGEDGLKIRLEGEACEETTDHQKIKRQCIET